jgi:hypothetical protein
MKKIIIFLSFLLVSFAGFSQTTVSDLVQMQFGQLGGIFITDTNWHTNTNAYCIQFIDKTRIDSISERTAPVVGGKLTLRWTKDDTIPAGTFLFGNFENMKFTGGTVSATVRVRFYPKK